MQAGGLQMYSRGNQMQRENAELCIFDSDGRDLSAAERRHKQ